MSSFTGLARRVILVAAVLLLVGGVGYGVWQWRSAASGGPAYRTEKAVRGKLVATINASGTLVPEEVIDVGAQVAGQVLAFGKDLDDSRKDIDYRARVEKDTVLARIDPTLYKADVEIARGDLAVSDADVVKANSDLESARTKVTQRQGDLDNAEAVRRQALDDLRRGEGQSKSSPNSITRTELNALRRAYDGAVASVLSATAAIKDAEAAVAAADASLKRAEKTVLRNRKALEKARENLAYCTIKSPVKGVIVDRRVNIGQTVVSSLTSPSLFLIAKDLTRMSIWATVNEADIGRIRNGQKVYFKVDAHPQEVFEGEVSQIRYNATMTNNVVTYTVVVTTKNEVIDPRTGDVKLLPYLTANLQFRVDQRQDVLLVPNATLRYRPSSPEKVVEEFREAYQKGQQRRPGAPVIQPVDARAKARQNRATVWVEENGLVRPIRVRTGLTDGIHTEVLEVLEGELPDGADLVTGEAQGKAAGGANPFAPKLFGNKKQ